MSNESERLLGHAKDLRKNMTREESRLWYDYLRTYPVRFRRQSIIGHYIADFYCPTAKIVIELDGSQHYENDKTVRYDIVRTNYISQYGILVARFLNYDVNTNFEGVCIEIDKLVKRRLSGGE